MQSGVADWPTYVEAVAAVFAAIGTVAAVMVALFYQPLRERRRMPRLHLEPPADARRGFPGSWHLLDAITLQVKAKRGRNSAEDVEVLATAMWWSRERPDEDPFVLFENRPLPWYESPETDGAHTECIWRRVFPAALKFSRLAPHRPSIGGWAGQTHWVPNLILGKQLLLRFIRSPHRQARNPLFSRI